MRKKYPTSSDTGDEELAKEAILVCVGEELIFTARLAVEMMFKARNQLAELMGFEFPSARFLDADGWGNLCAVYSKDKCLFQGSLDMSPIDGANVLIALIQKTVIDNQEIMADSSDLYSFKREAKHHKALGFILTKHPKFKSSELMGILKITSPKFTKGLFKSRPYVKKVKYISENDGYFANGEVYETETFNGAMYAIKGCSGKIGMSYFEDA
jgi:hypothetical protein